MGVGGQKNKTRKVKLHAGHLLSEETGEISPVFVAKNQDYDGTKFAKLFSGCSGMEALGIPGVAMLFYVADHLQPNHSFIKIDPEDVIAKTTLKDRQRVFHGMKALERYGLVVKKARSEWWVNQTMLMNGQHFNHANPANKKARPKPGS